MFHLLRDDWSHVVNSIRSQVEAIDRDQSVTDIRTMESVLDATLGQRRATVLLVAVFAGIALLLAMIGIYGVIAYSVAQRTQEVSIRLFPVQQERADRDLTLDTDTAEGALTALGARMRCPTKKAPLSRLLAMIFAPKGARLTVPV